MDNESIFLLLSAIAFFSGMLGIVLVFYIAATRIKQIDRVVHGSELSHDNIFYKLLRIQTYAGGFLWKWSARRSNLEGKIEGFDMVFRWPFIVCFILFFNTLLFLVITTVYGNSVGIN